MKIVLNKIFPFGSYYAINLFGLVLSKRPLSDEERAHEYIHTLQQRELLFLGFYLWYLIEWLVRLVQYRRPAQQQCPPPLHASRAFCAYRSISFEREAYAHQSSPDYPRHRFPFAWRRFLRRR